jgi:MFS family permease
MRRILGVGRPDRTARPMRPALVVAVLALCGNVTALQQTVVLPLVPELPRLLGASADGASWVVTATLISGALATPVVSRLADMYGKRSMVILCLIMMVTGSALGALSGSLGSVIAARALQGVGLALIPVGIAILQEQLPPSRVPLGVALMSATLAIGGAAGPPLAGLALQFFDWRALFWITGGAGVLVLLAVALVLSESRVRTGGAFDLVGAVLLSGATLGLLLALSKGTDWGWSNPSTLIALVGGLVVLLLWIPHQLFGRNPLVDLRSAASPQVLLVHVDALLLGFAMFVNLLVTIQLLQLPATVGLGLSAFQAGLWMIPGVLVFGLVAPFSAGISRRFGPRGRWCRVHLCGDANGSVAGRTCDRGRGGEWSQHASALARYGRLQCRARCVGGRQRPCRTDQFERSEIHAVGGRRREWAGGHVRRRSHPAADPGFPRASWRSRVGGRALAPWGSRQPSRAPEAMSRVRQAVPPPWW